MNTHDRLYWMEKRIIELEKWVKEQTLEGYMNAYPEPNIFDTEAARKLQSAVNSENPLVLHDQRVVRS